jgi:hypothetical protein
MTTTDFLRDHQNFIALSFFFDQSGRSAATGWAVT